MRKINVGKIEGYIRIFIGVLVMIIGSHGIWVLFPIGIIIVSTGAFHYCPINRTIGIDSKAARENYYFSYLPRYNPDPIFIFFRNGKLAFANAKAQKLFSDIKTIADLISIDVEKIQTSFDENEFNNLKIKDGYKHTYSVTLKGSDEIKGIIAYVHDVTELIRLDQEIISTQKEIIYAMGEIGETRSRETGNHVRRVAEYSYILAKFAGLSEEDSSLLKLASPMHDIGKVAIPDAILNKPRQLTNDEFAVMKKHSEIGFKMLNHSQRPILKAAAIVAGEHHERWNGSGYPNKKSGKNIHIFGRITALADTFDALSSERVYKQAWSLEKILKFIKEKKGKHFDPDLVSIFLENLDKFLEIQTQYRDGFNTRKLRDDV
jgi:putative two-component system response regulator